MGMSYSVIVGSLCLIIGIGAVVLLVIKAVRDISRED